jgi:hypothetical protein
LAIRPAGLIDRSFTLKERIIIDLIGTKGEGA